MHVRTLALLTLASLGACGKKATEPEPAAAAKPAKAKITADIPEGPDAQAFARKLIGVEVRWSPTSSSDFTHTALRFAPDGTWSADALVRAAGEELPCNEVGSWQLDSVEGPDTGTLVWSVVKTSCASRDAGTEHRVWMKIDPDGTTHLKRR